MIDSDLKKKLGINIDQLNQLLFNVDSSIKQNNEDSTLIKEEFSANLLKNFDLKITSTYENKIKNQMEEYKSTLGYLINFWREFKKFSLGIEYKDLFFKIKSAKDKVSKNIKKLGLTFLNQKNKPTQAIGNIKPFYSISNSDWINISNNLRKNRRFLELKGPLSIFLDSFLEKKFSEEIEKARKKYSNLTNDDINNFKSEFFKNRISFDDLWIKNRVETEKRPLDSTKVISKPKLDSNEQKKSEDFDNYEAYLKSDERQLARMKRAGIYNIKKKSKRVRKPKKTKN